MAAMSTLGEGHFRTKLEALPGERVVWEGGTDRRGILIRCARALGLILIPVSLLALFVLPLLLLPSPSRSEGKRLAPPSADTQTAPDTTNPRPAPRRILPLVFILSPIWLGLLLLVGTVVVESALSNRNAWYVVTSERLCIQSGAVTTCLTIMDLDKVLSVQVTASWLERRWGLQSIEFLHAGARVPTNVFQAARDRIVMAFVPSAGQLVGDLANAWLPRDNQRSMR